MYQVRALLLTKGDLWSKGMIQRLYLDDNESAIVYCLGTMNGSHWEPLRVQGKIAYAYRSREYAQAVCTSQNCAESADTLLTEECQKDLTVFSGKPMAQTRSA
jgi:hypothetical protein